MAARVLDPPCRSGNHACPALLPARRPGTREPFKVVKETLRNHQAPAWLSLDATNLSATVSTAPSRDQMPLDLNEQLVVEYYSR